MSEKAQEKDAEVKVSNDSEAKPADAEPIDSKPTDTKSTDSKPAEPTDSKPIESKPATDAKPTPVEAPPPMPKRPISPTEKVISDLHEAFPGIDEKYIKMALIASEGRVDPAFNALLYLSDPSTDIQIPTPRQGHSHGHQVGSSTRRQMKQDEELAKKLARQYEGRPGPGRSGSYGNRTNSQQWARKNYDDDSDDLGELYDTFTKNVEKVHTKFSNWVDNLAKKIDTETGKSNGNSGYNTRKDPTGRAQLFSAFDTNNRAAGQAPVNEKPPAVPPKDNTDEVLAKKMAPIKMNDETEEKKDSKSDWKDLSNLNPEPVSSDKFLVDSEEEEEDVKKTVKKE